MKSRRQIRREAKRIFKLCLAEGVMQEDRVRGVIKRVVESDRRERFSLLTQIRRLVRRECKNRSAVVESAAPLPEKLASSVQSSLLSRYGRGLNISFTHVPRLIGGMRIVVGSDVYDGSVRSRLNTLDSRM